NSVHELKRALARGLGIDDNDTTYGDEKSSKPDVDPVGASDPGPMPDYLAPRAEGSDAIRAAVLSAHRAREPAESAAARWYPRRRHRARGLRRGVGVAERSLIRVIAKVAIEAAKAD